MTNIQEDTQLSQNMQFKGSIVALVTPMEADGRVNKTALCRLIDWHIASGTHALVIMGTTGESALVSSLEHLAALETAIQYANARIPIIAGCGAVSTLATIELVKAINKLNPSGFLCVTPYYVKPSQQGLIQHFSQVADVCEAPLILYNVPGRTSCDLNNQSVSVLAKHPNICGLKDATGDLERLKELKNLVDERFSLLSGDDETAYEFVRLGGHGVITVTGNIKPKAVSRWWELLQARDVEAASVIFEQLKGLNQVLFIESNPIPVKWALAEMKKIEFVIRMPLTEPSLESQKKIVKILQQCESV